MLYSCNCYYSKVYVVVCCCLNTTIHTSYNQAIMHTLLILLMRVLKKYRCNEFMEGATIQPIQYCLKNRGN